VPVRAGFFYDPQPSEGSPDDYFGVSVGSGFILRRIAFDVAYQFRFGNGVSPTVSWIVGNLANVHEDVREHLVLFSLVYRFSK
jgi:hypothetical protein